MIPAASGRWERRTGGAGGRGELPAFRCKVVRVRRPIRMLILPSLLAAAVAVPPVGAAGDTPSEVPSAHAAKKRRRCDKNYSGLL
jgi:hypothetical protein